MQASSATPIPFSAGSPQSWRGGCAPVQSADAAPLAGLIFEMANVFFDDTVWRHWLWQLALRLGLRTDYRAFFERWDNEFLLPAQCGRRELREAFGAFLASHGFSWAQIDEVDAASRSRSAELAAEARTFPAVGETLANLERGGLKLVVLSDATVPADQLRRQLEHLGIERYFGDVISSFDLEATTPDARCYQAALDSLALPASRAAYVGHHCRGLSGATAMGLRTVSLNVGSTPPGDVTISRFAELRRLADPCVGWPANAADAITILRRAS
jgi:FMN phosphatase YigB (HAD superfamily)